MNYLIQENIDLSKGGIYQINNKVYIGLTKNFKSRFKQHFSKLIKNNHINNYLQYSFNKYRKTWCKRRYIQIQ